MKEADIRDILCAIEEKLGPQSQVDPAGVSSTVTRVISTGEVPQRIAEANPSRTALWIYNEEGNGNLHLTPSPVEGGENLYSLIIKAGDALIMNAANFAAMYQGKVYGFWAGSQNPYQGAMVTEFFVRE